MNETNFTVYPNPIISGQTLNINSGLNGFMSLSIMTIDGNNLITNHYEDISLNNSLPIVLNPGIYILRIESKDITSNFKLIVNN